MLHMTIMMQYQLDHCYKHKDRPVCPRYDGTGPFEKCGEYEFSSLFDLIRRECPGWKDARRKG
jgi:hypothetical protein